VRVALLMMMPAVSGVAVPVVAQGVTPSYHLNIPRQLLDGDLKDLAVVATNSVSLSGPQFTTFPQSTSSLQDDRDNNEGKKSPSDGFRTAQVDQGAPANSPTVERENEHASENKRVLLEEIVVTAQKRTERLQDVPVPVTVLKGETLVDTGKTRLESYYTTVPGLSMASSGGGDANLTIRGISTGANTNPTVGIVLDDVPFGSTSTLATATFAPDIDPSDLARIEVLRGPQGTLYGASSIGGLLKFVTVDPSTERLSGRVQADTSRVYNGAAAGTVRERPRMCH
jgi:outer membrane receptor protein involved in Fe transport